MQVRAVLRWAARSGDLVEDLLDVSLTMNLKSVFMESPKRGVTGNWSPGQVLPRGIVNDANQLQGRLQEPHNPAGSLNSLIEIQGLTDNRNPNGITNPS
jgi:hypothetical protein